jgi:hypothetical protein
LLAKPLPKTLSPLLERKNEIKAQISKLKTEVRGLHIQKGFSRGETRKAKGELIATTNELIANLQAKKKEIKGNDLVIEYNRKIDQEMKNARYQASVHGHMF